MITGFQIPLYSWAGVAGNINPKWQAVIDQKMLHPNVPFIAKINPSSGPGSSASNDFLKGIAALQAAGIKVLGYIGTHYASKSTDDVKSEIDKYHSFYPNLDGIFFDEMPNIPGFEPYYTIIGNYAKILGFTLTEGNPGTALPFTYDGILDGYEISENSGLPAASVLAARTSGFKKSFCYFNAHDTPTLDAALLSTLLPLVSYLFVTNDGPDGNPYDSVPSYLAAEIALLDSGVVPSPTPTPTPVPIPIPGVIHNFIGTFTGTIT